jgi:hypothetical protein
MNILFLTDNFPPERNAPASRTYEHALEWVRAGHRVTVITTAPNFPEGKLFDGFRNSLYSAGEMDGIRVIRVWSYIAPNSGFRIVYADGLDGGSAGAKTRRRRLDIAAVFLRGRGLAGDPASAPALGL